MKLRVRHKEGIAILATLTPQSTLLDLHNAIAEEIHAHVERLEVKTGYPPKLLVIDDKTAYSSLESLGVTDGEQIVTSERPEGSPSTFNFASPQPTSKAPAAVEPPATPPPTSSIASGNAASKTTFATTTGTGGSHSFGSRPVVESTGTLTTFQARGNSIDNPIGESSSFFESIPVEAALFSVARQDSIDAIRIRDEGLLVVREVADDNSCLFNAIAYTLDPSMKNNVKALRQIVADAIEANPEAYPDVVLGHPRMEYCDKIKRENSWGGAIELAIFSDHYKVEIDSIDVSTNRVDRFGMTITLFMVVLERSTTELTQTFIGEGQYSQRALLMYSGIHYDALALTPSLDIPAECDQTQFDASSEDIINAGIQLAARLKKVVCDS
ncbi:ubiquitin-specific protease otu1 [Modicella reniformis]|uniref:Ubiquitin thioesterase OTU n=1 Tax=Modicella reniformis TaxID=1440133 RepID=A0A9P6MBE0_9FUNG|nr:ubiquitin-specific protease otu1 [Modicella reniformis]